MIGEMTLMNPGTGTGRRIRFDLAPDTALRDAAAFAAATPGEWKPAQETAVRRAELPAPARDVVSRYFDALRTGAAK